MKGSTNNWMKRGAAAALLSCLLLAATSVAAAADGLSVTTQQESSTKSTVQVRNDSDREFSGVVDVPVVVAGVPTSVPVNVELAPGQSASFTLDLSRVHLPIGPVFVITDEGTPF